MSPLLRLYLLVFVAANCIGAIAALWDWPLWLTVVICFSTGWTITHFERRRILADYNDRKGK